MATDTIVKQARPILPINLPSKGAKVFKLTSKVAIVTGASRGIGEAITKGFAKAGADLGLPCLRRLDLRERSIPFCG